MNYKDLEELKEIELKTYNGGSVKGLLWDIACFAVSPALGFYNLGIKHGYREAAQEAAAANC